MDLFHKMNVKKATSLDFNAEKGILYANPKARHNDAKMLNRRSRRKMKHMLKEELSHVL